MNENIDLTKILKDCPKGWEFWSPIFGDVKFERNYEIMGFFNIIVVENGTEWPFNYDATITMGCIKSKEIMLYPSRENRDWSKFTAPWYKKDKFDPKTLQAFDKVIVRDATYKNWKCDFFSYIFESATHCSYRCVGDFYMFCIPYNDETKHLVGTTEEAPEFYRYWED